MIDESALKKMGFEIICEEIYAGKNGSINVIIWDQEDILKAIVPCASPIVDNENEIEKYLKSSKAYEKCISKIYRDRNLEIEYKCCTDNEKENAIKNISEIIEALKNKFDILPVCTCCKRSAPCEIMEMDGGFRTVCGICADENKLITSQAELNAKNIEKGKNDEKSANGFIKYMRFGFNAGIKACIAGFIVVVLGLFIPTVSFYVWIPGIIGGYCTIKSMKKTNFNLPFSAFITVNIFTLLTILIFSLVNIYIVDIILMCLSYGARIIDRLSNLYIINVVFGLLGYILAEFVTGFWLSNS